MELSEAWTPDVTIEEIETDGTLLNDKYDNGFHRYSEDKVLCKLYYLKSRDLFAVVRGTGHWSVISSQYIIDGLRCKYLNQECKKSVDNEFVENDDSHFTAFKSDLDVNNIEYIKQHGRFLERIESNNCDVYYLEEFDKFVVFDFVEKTGYDMDAYDYRERFGIPFKNERFSSL